MYTRSRSSGGPQGFGNGRGQMNQGGGNSFQSPNAFNHQPGNYKQSNYTPGIIEPSAPFKPSSGGQNEQQGMKNPQQMSPMQPSMASTPRLKPILKQSTLSSNIQNNAADNSSQNAAPKPTPTPTPVPPPNVAPTTASSTATAAAVAGTAVKAAESCTLAKETPTVSSAASATAASSAVATTVAAPAATASAAASAAVTTTAASKPDGNTSNTEKSSDDAANANASTDSTAANADKSNSEDPRRWMDEDGKWMDTDEQGQWMDTEDGEGERPKWRRFKKLTTNKPNKKLKRLRMNQRLRKTLIPKNAIMVLNEMKAGVQFTFPETQALMPNSLFLVHAELDGKTYVGQGLSKPLARQNAAENALKCLLLEKMTAAAIKDRVDSDGDVQMEPGEITQAKEDNADENTEESDEIPWSSLASFALYKLFLEWQNQGTVVPLPRPGLPPLTKIRAEPKPPTEKVLPPNATEIHPVMLLNQMRPGTTYTEVGRIGNPPNTQFTLGVEINGFTYTGSAKNKKDAKKIAAKEALKALYSLEYPEEPKPDIATDIALQLE